MPGPARKQNRSDRAYAYLRAAVLNGELNPGYPISELEVSERLAMSRTPVREAVVRLIADGLLERLPGRGTFIKSLDVDEIRLVYEYAEGLEGMVSFLVAQYRGLEAGPELMACAEAMDAALSAAEGAEKSEEAWAAADDRFHETLYRYCPNPVIVAGLENVHRQVQFVRLRYSAVLTDRKQSSADHRATAEAIVSGDRYLAREVAQRHWERVRTDLVAAQARIARRAASMPIPAPGTDGEAYRLRQPTDANGLRAEP
jgi:DNA-binding GntR family transcriptional regulator